MSDFVGPFGVLPLTIYLGFEPPASFPMAASASKFTPPPSPPSPSGSFYDVSDDEETDYNTIASTTPRRGVKLLFSKSKVRMSRN